MANEKKEKFASNDINDNGLSSQIPSMPFPPGDLSGICHLVGPGSGEVVRKPLLGGGHLLILLLLLFQYYHLKYACLDGYV